MDFKGHKRNNIPYYSRETWGMGQVVWVVSGVHHQNPAHLEKVWVGFTVIGKEEMSN